MYHITRHRQRHTSHGHSDHFLDPFCSHLHIALSPTVTRTVSGYDVQEADLPEAQHGYREK
eukprot:1180282-Prorocentrum_minimum.AAC.3